jgi:DNA replication protein DnaC
LAESPYLQEQSLKEVLGSYNHIDLTEDEVDEAMLAAKRRKEALIKEEIERKAVEERRRLFIANKFTYDQTKAFMLYRAKNIFDGEFKLDAENSVVFELMCRYFSEDDKFISDCTNLGIKNASLDKGIFLLGNFGVGKTWMMMLFARNQRQVFDVYNAKDISKDYQENGEEAMAKFLNKKENAFQDPTAFYQKYSGLSIDDIGTEDIKNNYGNKKSVILDIFEQRYIKKNTGIFLHGTSNLTTKQLEEYYGGRVTSRMREVLNIIELPGEDRRK